MRKPSFLATFFFVLVMSSFFSDWNSELGAQEGLEALDAVSVNGNTLSVDIEEMPLNLVFEELGRQINITFFIPESVGKTPVSDKFRALPLEAGIRRLLQGHNYMLEYTNALAETGGQDLPRALKVRVLAKMTANEVTRIRQTLQTSRQMEKTSESRVAELLDLADKGDNKRLEKALAKAIDDPDQEVREIALDILEDMNADAPAEFLVDMALRDPIPELRGKALEIIAEVNPQAALDPLNQALQDENADVREIALDLLEDLKEELKDGEASKR